MQSLYTSCLFVLIQFIKPPTVHGPPRWGHNAIDLSTKDTFQGPKYVIEPPTTMHSTTAEFPIPNASFVGGFTVFSNYKFSNCTAYVY